MGEYKRLISYIYSYERGSKSKNAGFAKIESRNGICKVNISLRIVDELMNEAEDNMLEVFFFYRENSEIRKIFLERIKIVNGCSVLKLRINSDDIGNAGISIDKITGIFICTKAFLFDNDILNIVYASEWDDISIAVDKFKEKYENKMLQEPQDMDYNENIIIASEVEEQNENEKEVCNNKLVEMLKEEQKKDEIDDIGSTVGDYFKMLCNCYPKVKVNEINGECIKITPHDISYLPKKYWNLCNNSFLLHGFYNYKYLLLCEKIMNAEKKYLVGVPGMFHQKEQVIAKMFGFTEFEGKNENNSMKFGYWCMYL